MSVDEMKWEEPAKVDVKPFEAKPEVKQETMPALPGERKEIIPAAENGVLVGTSFEAQYRLARAYHASGMMPQALNTPEKVMVAIQLCYELGLPPMTSIGQICVINGTPNIWGDLPLALVMRSGKLQKKSEEWLTHADGSIYGFRFMCQRIGDEPVIREFTLEDARQAQLLHKDIWKKYTKRMLQCRARAWALKDTFPDVLKGVAIAEYDYNVIPESDKEVTVDRRDDGKVAGLQSRLRQDQPQS